MENGDASRRVKFDAAKEMESPRFRAILRATSGRRRRPSDAKSYSHELNPDNIPIRRLRGLSSPEELMNAMKSKFTKLKQEVDSELGTYAGDLVGLLESTSGEHPEWRVPLEDLLLIARQCAEMPPEDFWLKCERIVQNLDDRRQELPSGALKQAHTRILFILTRCTRLLQFQKEGSYANERHVLGMHQLSDLGFYPFKTSSGHLGGKTMLSVKEIKERLLLRKMLENRRPSDSAASSSDDDSLGNSGKISSWKKFPSLAEKMQKKNHEGDKHFDSYKQPAKTKMSLDEIAEKLHAARMQPADGLTGLPVNVKDQSGYIEGMGIPTEGSKIICRICDFEIPTVHAEGHFTICTIADRCDSKGLSVDQRLEQVAQVLAGTLSAFPTKNSEVNHESAGASASSLTENSKGLSVTKDGISHLDRALSTEPFPEAGTHTPPTESMVSQLQSLTVNGSKALLELESSQQIESLFNISRGIEGIRNSDDNAVEKFISYVEDLNAVIDTKKVEGLIVDTFGTRIAKLLQEKFIQLCGQPEDISRESSYSTICEDGEVESSVSSRASHLNGKFKDRTSIEDFEIIKPISRGAFGRVFLARKKVTGDVFAIKVLKKADMIRKNAVESILAERDILISARNPFVVRFFYSFTCRENLYLVMEYLNGGDLYSLLRNLGCLDEDMARMYIAEIVLALEYLHKSNVIHRDLKPDNLLISRDGHIKLTDFGLSKVGLINSTDDLSGPDMSSSLVGDYHPPAPDLHAQKREQRQKQAAIGTPDYLAPEILLGVSHGPTADWWSVGIILFELLVGIPPFNAEHPQKIFDNILNHDVPWPKVPDEMSYEAYDLIDKLLIENPNQRLGATGAGEVKAHPFFKNINWDMLTRQKASFIPAMEDEYDTSYFATRHPWGAADEQFLAPHSDYDDACETSSMSCGSSPHSYDDEEGDEFGSMEDFSSTLSVKYSFSNFSFKNISQLASINYDLITKSNQDSIGATKS